MRELFEANALILSELERRANGACVVYHDLELPPGCVPPRSDVGVEVDPASGETSLLVRGATGPDGLYEIGVPGRGPFHLYGVLAANDRIEGRAMGTADAGAVRLVLETAASK